MRDLFRKHGLQTQGVLSVTPREALELLKEGAVLLDLRDRAYTDYKTFDVEPLFIFPKEDFDQRVDEMDRDGFYILADSSGIKSRLYAEKMKGIGFVHAASLSGGFVEWERDGLPVRENLNERLSGACACQLRPRERKRDK